MAKKLHPLDVRYKGPSTAYTGNVRKEKMFDAPVAKPQSAKVPPPLPNRRTESGASPWGGDSPRLQPGLGGPPPLPLPDKYNRPRRNSTMRVFFGLAIFTAIVLANIYVVGGRGLSGFGLNTELQAIEL